ncbi:DMT family transporter [Candidatus Woesearchaeota archaeon]|nr:DMT family transporter [Candidatus Woesearchaeota archaeon]
MSKALAYAVISVLLVSTSFVGFQYILQYVSTGMAMLLWFLSAAGASLAILVFRKTSLRQLAARHWRQALILGVINTLTLAFWAFAIKSAGASLTAFFMRFSTIFAIILGIALLREKLNKWEVAGAVLAVAGAAAISWQEQSAHLGILLAVAAALTLAVQQFYEKIAVRNVEPYSLNALRTSVTFLLLLPLLASMGSLGPVPAEMLPVIIIGSTASAVAGFIFWYKALQGMEMSKGVIVRTLEPFVVVMYVLLVFGTIPTAIQLVGGAMIVGGVVLSQVK